jgi:hypothetical protein
MRSPCSPFSLSIGTGTWLAVRIRRRTSIPLSPAMIASSTTIE